MNPFAAISQNSNSGNIANKPPTQLSFLEQIRNRSKPTSSHQQNAEGDNSGGGDKGTEEIAQKSDDLPSKTNLLGRLGLGGGNGMSFLDQIKSRRKEDN